MLAVHQPQDAVRARLHRQVQIGHQGLKIGVGGDQVLAHVVGVAGGVADAVQPRHLGQRIGEARQRPRLPVRTVAVIGVDVLAQQGDLAHAAPGQRPRLLQHLEHRPRPFGAARIGHHAEGAELVAALLHGQEGGDARAAALGRQGVELVHRREVGADPLAAGARRAGQQLRQLVIGLGADDQIHRRLATHDLLALGLGHAAGHGDGHGGARRLRLGLLQLLQLAEFGIDLFGRLFANVAGVQDDEVGVVRRVRLGIAQRAQHIGHALGVIDVHLAAVGLDEQALGRVLGPGGNEGVGHVSAYDRRNGRGQGGGRGRECRAQGTSTSAGFTRAAWRVKISPSRDDGSAPSIGTP